MIDTQAQISPRESIQHEWDVEMFNKQSAHVAHLKKLEIDSRKLELQLRREDAQKSRKHAESLKELEYAIRYNETRWRSLLRLPALLILLPVYIILAIGCTIRLAQGKEIPQQILNLLQ